MTNNVTKKSISNSAPSISTMEILQILQILSVYKSAVNELPEGPAAGAKPSDIRRARPKAGRRASSIAGPFQSAPGIS